MTSRGRASTSTPRSRKILIRWCPSIIVPSSRVFRAPSLRDGGSQLVLASSIDRTLPVSRRRASDQSAAGPVAPTSQEPATKPLRSPCSPHRRGTPRPGACAAPPAFAEAHSGPPRRSKPTAAKPSVATFTSSCESTSAAETLNPILTRSRIDRTTCRFSFSVRLSRTNNRTFEGADHHQESGRASRTGKRTSGSETASVLLTLSPVSCLPLRAFALDLDLEGLDHVADLHVVEAGDLQAALEALADFLDVVLEPLEAVEADDLFRRRDRPPRPRG